MFEDDKDTVENEKNEKQFKFIDKRKYSEDSEGKEIEAEADTQPDIKNLNSDKAESDDKTQDMSQLGADFSTFVYSLNTQVLLFLGKIPNPTTGKYEKDITMAKYLIDTIDMLSKKTKGNLDQNEGKLIENILYDLRMAFVSEK